MIASHRVDSLNALRTAAESRTPVSIGPRRTASPHEFYRYPARFPPTLARAAIQAFTNEGDLVLDPFVGGGTTLVESRLLGRPAIGSDINRLATFVSRVKTRVYTASALPQIQRWITAATTFSSRHVMWPTDMETLPYFANFDSEHLTPIRAALLSALSHLDVIDDVAARNLARCILLRSSQWALDMRQDVPDVAAFLAVLEGDAATTIAAAKAASRHYRAADRQVAPTAPRRTLVLDIGLPGLARNKTIANYPRPALILTSPPYPGVYVNYHRWKVQGRRETPLPYFVVGQHDGNGLAYYTMSARSDRTLDTYFAKLRLAFLDLSLLCDDKTWVVQVVGFNNPHDQLRRYLSVMHECGFIEVTFPQTATAEDGRLWRDVPGRRWWARAGDRSDAVPHTAREVLLFHRRQ